MVLGGVFLIKVKLTNEILKYITEIEKNRYIVDDTPLSYSVASRLKREVLMHLIKLRGIL